MTIVKYQNGNCDVSIDTENGTKTRSCEGIARPDFPESIDLKITNRCDLGCDFCHESSVSDGKHALLLDIVRITKGLPPGVEIAIGGGNPLNHPLFAVALHYFSDKGFISNITVNADHVIKTYDMLNFLCESSLIYGIGLSGNGYSISLMRSETPNLFDNNTVRHFIVGIDNPFDIIRMGISCKILILGYKQRGRGEEFYDEKVKRNIDGWVYFLPAILSKKNFTMSFDNLALKQLPVQRHVSSEVWQSSYMGDDGQFTMFVDAVRMEYASSSADETRRPLNGMTIIEAFQTLKEKL